MQAHFDTGTHTDTDRQTDRETDAHTRISNHIPKPTPSVEVSQYRTVCVRCPSDPAWGRRGGNRSRQYATLAYPLATTNGQSDIHACLYISTITCTFHSYKQGSVPNHLWHPFYVHDHYTHPVWTTKTHTHTTLSTIYSSLLTVSSVWPLNLCLCIWEGSKGGRRWRISDRMDTWYKKISWSDISGLCVWT